MQNSLPRTHADNVGFESEINSLVLRGLMMIVKV
jgi:hypothetical protein